MVREILVISIAVILIFGISKLSFAMMCGGHSQHQQTAQTESGEDKHEEHEATMKTTKESVNVGNKICPVSGEKIDEKMKATYEYEGKVYNFCCEMCIEEFKKDPEKYIKKVDDELKQESKTMHKGMHEGHHH